MAKPYCICHIQQSISRESELFLSSFAVLVGLAQEQTRQMPQLEKTEYYVFPIVDPCDNILQGVNCTTEPLGP